MDVDASQLWCRQDWRWQNQAVSGDDRDIDVDADGIVLTVEDDGRPFDPIGDAPAVDTESPVAERPVGGLGLFLVKELARSVDYERTGETNRLSVRVHRTDEA